MVQFAPDAFPLALLKGDILRHPVFDSVASQRLILVADEAKGEAAVLDGGQVYFGVGDEEYVITFFVIGLGLDCNLFDLVFVGRWVRFGEYFIVFLTGGEFNINRAVEDSDLEFYLLVCVNSQFLHLSFDEILSDHGVDHDGELGLLSGNNHRCFGLPSG